MNTMDIQTGRHEAQRQAFKDRILQQQVHKKL